MLRIVAHVSLHVSNINKLGSLCVNIDVSTDQDGFTSGSSTANCKGYISLSISAWDEPWINLCAREMAYRQYV